MASVWALWRSCLSARTVLRCAYPNATATSSHTCKHWGVTPHHSQPRARQPGMTTVCCHMCVLGRGPGGEGWCILPPTRLAAAAGGVLARWGPKTPPAAARCVPVTPPPSPCLAFHVMPLPTAPYVAVLCAGTTFSTAHPARALLACMCRGSAYTCTRCRCLGAQHSTPDAAV